MRQPGAIRRGNWRTPVLETALRRETPAWTFALPAHLEAEAPPEVRASGRDDVRLLVAHQGGALVHARFRQLGEFLRPGDLLVLNDSATIPASLRARREDGSELDLHLSTRLPAQLVVVEPALASVRRYEQLSLPDGGRAVMLVPYQGSSRLWIAHLTLPGELLPYLALHGQPIAYRHLTGAWPIEAFQNVYAAQPGSAEMPSAGRPFTCERLDALRARGVRTAFITLHAGVSTALRGERPYEEWYRVPAETALSVHIARRHGGRVVAVGTTVVRALESSLDDRGRVVASQGWTDLYITPERGASTVDGVLTGWHEPDSSHLAMLEAIGGAATVRRAYAAALAAGYLWHEFGDSNLILR